MISCVNYLSYLYRFGYNGMEKDPEIKGEGNSYTTEFRQYDPRLGRWLSLDPLMRKFPWQSPYCAFDNNPIYYTDPYGLSATNGEDEDEEGLCGGPKLMMYDGRKGGGTIYEKVIEESCENFNPDFGRNGRTSDGTHNDSFFKQNNDGNLELIKNDSDITPYKGIEDIFNNSANYSFDCAEYVMVLHLRAQSQTLGEKKFNQKYEDGLIIGNKTSNTTGIKVEKFYNRDLNENYYYSSDNPVKKTLKDIISEMKIGTRVSFTCNTLPNLHNYHNENAIVSGFDEKGNPLFAAHPMGNKLTMKDIINNLVREVETYNNENNIKMTQEEILKTIFLSEIEIIKE
ncbi:MAG: hypothetical protein HYR91_05175 [Flavobacteriia bacterium]|nr:hypothetical protein [Flavobacteriia bacterium]